MTNTPFRIHALLAACLLALAPASALATSVTEDFGTYAPGNSVKAGQTDFGSAAGGWLSPWRATVGDAVTVATIANDKPLNSGGNYFSTIITPNAGKPLVGGSLTRAYDAGTVTSSGTAPVSIRFDFRADTAPDNVRFNLSEAGRRSAFYDGTASWVLSAYDGKWHVGDRFTFADTGVPFRAGVVYRIAIKIDPVALSWDITLSGDTAPVTINHLSFRAKAWTTDAGTPNARWLTFSASEILPEGAVSAGNISASFSVDTITIGAP